MDPEAEFLFVPAAEVKATAAREGATPFDTQGARLGHRDGRCSFETIIDEYGPRDRDLALARMAEIVHGADVSADLDRVPESRGLKAIAEGFGIVYPDDHAILQAEFPVYDAVCVVRPPAYVTRSWEKGGGRNEQSRAPAASPRGRSLRQDGYEPRIGWSISSPPWARTKPQPMANNRGGR